MSSSPPPAPQPGNTGKPAPSQEEKSATSRPAEPAPPVPDQGIPRPNEQTAPTTQPRREERPQGHRTNLGATPPPLKLTPLSFNVDVQRRRLDPFVLGVMMGAIAAIIGMLIGLSIFLLN